jgi:tRNA(Arg) A34 adenosine deaminase TadA
MCTAAISLARIKKLIFAASSSKTGAVANGIKYLNSKHIIHKVKWDAGLLENEARELMKTFFSTLRSKNKVGFL